MEVLEELEEFSERERDFESKYVKTISQLKNDADKTDNELSKVCSKPLDRTLYMLQIFRAFR